MPRVQREKSGTGIYHVVYRGINRQKIFWDHEDYERFLSLLKKYRETCGYEIYAYCLMPNHIHLLIKEGTEDLGRIFKRIGASFVYWYNLKYERTGHLFQDRYRSEVVEDDSYLLTVIRYIHRNPVKAGICSEPEDYRYSSMKHYATDPVVNSGLVLGMLGAEEFKRYHHAANDDICLDNEEAERKKLSDREALKLMGKYHCHDASEFQNAEKDVQERIIRELLEAGGSLRQINRLTGATIGIIRKYR